MTHYINCFDGERERAIIVLYPFYILCCMCVCRSSSFDSIKKRQKKRPQSQERKSILVVQLSIAPHTAVQSHNQTKSPCPCRRLFISVIHDSYTQQNKSTQAYTTHHHISKGYETAAALRHSRRQMMKQISTLDIFFFFLTPFICNLD